MNNYPMSPNSPEFGPKSGDFGYGSDGNEHGHTKVWPCSQIRFVEQVAD